MVWLPEDFEDAICSSAVADMVNRPGFPTGSHIGGYFIYAQVQDVPGVRWAHFDLGDPVHESFHTGFGPNERATGYSVELLATLTRNVIADDASRSARL